MSKDRAITYEAPRLVARGDVVWLTKALGSAGVGDPDNPAVYQRKPVGSPGFLL